MGQALCIVGCIASLALAFLGFWKLSFDVGTKKRGELKKGVIS